MELLQQMFQRYKFLCILTIAFFGSTTFFICFLYGRSLIIDNETIGPNSTDAQTLYDTYIFTQSWLPGFNQNTAESKWTIYGLRPYNTTIQQSPENCSNVPFSENDIQSILEDLLSHWPPTQNLTGNLTNDAIQSWADEWSTYGTCVDKSIFTYFNTTLSLFNKYDINNTLAANNITPSLSTRYPIVSIQSAISKTLGSLPAVTCKNDTLQDIQLCHNKSWQLVNCSSELTQCNSSEVYYLPLEKFELDWDVFMLAINWLPTLNPSLNNANWTIHGLWPSTTRGAEIANCSNDTFVVEELLSIIDEMTWYWPTSHIYSNNVTEDSLSFWEHEWDKHGTCALQLETVKNLLAYFSKGLAEYKNYNLVKILEDADILPTADTSKIYALSDIEAALQKRLNVSTIITCDNQELEEIRICLNLEFQLVDCPGSSSGCSTDVIYPLPSSASKYLDQSSNSASRDVKETKLDWDIFVLAINWLPTLNPSLNNSNWTIHGLWPSATSSADVANCSNDTFVVEELLSIIDEMTLYWPTSHSYSDNVTDDSLSFWEHEWDKHGTCALQLETLENILAYFNKTLEEYKHYNIFKILEDAEIVPTADTSKTYALSDIEAALQKILNVSTIITCDNQELEEIRICLNLEFQLVDCPGSSNGCSKNVTYPLPSSASKYLDQSSNSTWPDVKETKLDWDIFVLALNWLPTLNPSLNNANWTVHGLWLSATSGSDVADCSNDPFIVEELLSIIDEMTLYWPTSHSYSDNVTDDSLSFWEHEWDKHGTCALQLETLENILAYFNRALQEYKNYNLFKILEDAQIVPTADTSETYALIDIESALQKGLNVSTIITCDNKELEEIRICLNLEFQLVDCPGSSSGCSKNVTYPLP